MKVNKHLTWSPYIKQIFLLLTGLGFWVVCTADELPPVAESKAEVFSEVSVYILDGDFASASAYLERALVEKNWMEAERQAITILHDSLVDAQKLNSFFMQGLEAYRGKRIAYQGPDGVPRQGVLMAISPPDRLQVSRNISGGGTTKEEVFLTQFTDMQKFSMATDMPQMARALVGAYVAWENKQFEPFQKMAAMTGELNKPLVQTAKELFQNQQQDSSQHQQAHVIPARKPTRTVPLPTIRPKGEWETFTSGEEVLSDVVNPFMDVTLFSKKVSSKAGGDSKVTGLRYKIYLPDGYDRNVETFYPVMFISSPGGNANPGNLKQRYQKDGWVVVCLVDSKNGSNSSLNNFIAAYDDVVKRIRIAPGAKFATGMSGGARMSSLYPAVRPGFRGLILQAAGAAYGFDPDDFDKNIDFYRDYPGGVAIAGTFGDKDMNFRETHNMRLLLNPNSPLLISPFAGNHTWAPKDLMNNSLDWLEEVTFIHPPRDPANFDFFTSTGAEPTHPIAYKWFFMLTASRAREAESPYESYFHWMRLPAIIQNGNIGTDSEVQEVIEEARAEISRLLQDREVTEKKQVELLYKTFNEHFGDYNEKISKISGEPFQKGYRHKYGSSIRTSGEKAVNIGRNIVSTYPATPQADFLKVILWGLEHELSIY